MKPKQYWVRFVYADQACKESDYLKTQDVCRYVIQETFKNDPEVRFAYVMTYDAFGECFVDLVRRGAA